MLCALLLAASGGAALADDLGRFCPENRWVVRNGVGSGKCAQLRGGPNADFPDPPARLYPESDDRRDLPPLVEELSRYCLFESENTGAVLRGEDFVEEGTEASKDCVILGLAAESTNGPAPLVAQRQRSDAQPPPSPAESRSEGGATVRLAILDTAPTNDENPEKDRCEPEEITCSAHGPELVRVVRGLLDRRYLSGVRLVSRRALSWGWLEESHPPRAVRAPDENAGAFGTPWDLAKAVVDEVVARKETGDDHLVLNLSIGWEALWGEADTPSELRPSLAAVFQALKYARCEGALIFAAVGNRSGGPEALTAAGPLLPAAWERWTVDDCDCSGPLLFAVGGIGADDRYLPNRRFGSLPSLVALGEHAFERDANGRPRRSMTGTSVSTAFVSAAATATWAAAGDGGPRCGHEVAERLYSETMSGEHWRVEFPKSSRGRHARKILPPRHLPGPARTAWRALGPYEPPDLHVKPVDLALLGRMKMPSTCRLPAGLGGPDRVPEIYPNAVLPVPQCLQWRLFGQGILPAFGPQPDSSACPSCKIDRWEDDEHDVVQVMIEIDGVGTSALQRGTPLAASLWVGETTEYGLGVLENGRRYRFLMDRDLIRPGDPILLAVDVVGVLSLSAVYDAREELGEQTR